jgi:prepilin-type N-terminal cleavage/methylation domain-containing protein
VNRSLPRRHGVSLPEVMIAIVIVALLMIATAIALNASFSAHAVNQEQADLMQRMRLAVNRMATSIRTTQAHSPVDEDITDDFTRGITVTDTGIAMLEDDGTNLVYRYDADTNRLLAVVNGEEHTLLEGVLDFNIRLEPMRSADSIKTGSGWDLLRRATFTITLQTPPTSTGVGESTGKQTLTVSASAMPRRNCL